EGNRTRRGSSRWSKSRQRSGVTNYGPGVNCRARDNRMRRGIRVASAMYLRRNAAFAVGAQGAEGEVLQCRIYGRRGASLELKRLEALLLQAEGIEVNTKLRERVRHSWLHIAALAGIAPIGSGAPGSGELAGAIADPVRVLVRLTPTSITRSTERAVHTATEVIGCRKPPAVTTRVVRVA